MLTSYRAAASTLWPFWSWPFSSIVSVCLFVIAALHHASIYLILCFHDLEDFFWWYCFQHSFVIFCFELGHVYFDGVNLIDNLVGLLVFAVLFELLDLSSHISLLISELIVNIEEGTTLFGCKVGGTCEPLLDYLLELVRVKLWLPRLW